MARKGRIAKSREKDEISRLEQPRKYELIFLVVCEDQKVEPTYFEKIQSTFPPDTLYLRAVGTGRNYIGVVQEAIAERNRLEEEARRTPDKVWAVFDKDDADKSEGNTKRFIDAFTLAEKENVEIAYSNEVFELWLLLHFEKVMPDRPLPRNEIYTRLENAIKSLKGYEDFIYDHGDPAVLEHIFRSGNENEAISRAEYLLEVFKKKTPINANPSTKVCILVKMLRDYFEWFTSEV